MSKTQKYEISLTILASLPLFFSQRLPICEIHSLDVAKWRFFNKICSMNSAASYILIYINHLILTITNILRILYKYVLNDPRICLCLCACICKNKIDCLAKYISGQASVFCFWVKDKLGNCKMGEIYVQPQLQTNFVTLNFLFLFSIGFSSFVVNRKIIPAKVEQTCIVSCWCVHS